MFDPRDYKVIVVKKDRKEPVRLEKEEMYDWSIDWKLNLIIFILLIIFFLILCFILVPPTYGFFRY